MNMKNIFNINHKNSSRPIAFFIIFLFIIAILLNLFGCGNDGIITNNNNPPTSNDSLMFSIDSFTVYSAHSPRTRSFQFIDSVTVIRKYRIVCDAISNVPLSNDTAAVYYTFFGYPSGPLVQLGNINEETQNLHMNYSTQTDTSFHYNNIRHFLDAGFFGSYPVNTNYYIKVTKFQIYLVH